MRVTILLLLLLLGKGAVVVVIMKPARWSDTAQRGWVAHGRETIHEWETVMLVCGGEKLLVCELVLDIWRASDIILRPVVSEAVVIVCDAGRAGGEGGTHTVQLLTEWR